MTGRGLTVEPTRAGRAGEDAVAGGSAVYSIGHSSHPLERFLELLRLHGIELVADVRSAPYSRHAPHMSGRNLRGSLAAVGIGYLYLGGELGGRPEEDALYDSEGHVLYGRVAATGFFAAGLERLLDEAGRARVAVMCAEEDPAGCHRRLLVGRALAGRGVGVLHVRGDGRVETEADLAARGERDRQQPLFADPAEEWRSPLPAPRGRPRRAPGATEGPRAYGARTVFVADARAPSASTVTVSQSGVPGWIRPRVYQEK